jgi:hypothetical protein
MEYKGGVPNNRFPSRCWHLGLFVVMPDPDRRVKPTDTGHNLMQQSRLTQGSR